MFIRLVKNGVESRIDPCAYYKVVVNDDIANQYFVGSTKLLPSGTSVEIILAEYVKRNTPINPRVDGRLINCDLTFHTSCLFPEVPLFQC